MPQALQITPDLFSQGLWESNFLPSTEETGRPWEVSLQKKAINSAEGLKGALAHSAGQLWLQFPFECPSLPDKSYLFRV